MRRHRWWVLALPIVFLTPPASAQSSGATGRFGRGIVTVSDNGTAVHLDLSTAGNGVLLRVAPHATMRILQAGAWPAGPSVVRIPAREPDVLAQTTSAGSGDPARAEQAAREERLNCEGPSTGDRLIDTMHKGECKSIMAPVEQGARTTTLLRAPAREYLLLVLSDQPLDTADVAARLAALASGSAGAAPRDVAEYLVGGLGGAWAGYRIRR